MNTDGHLDFNYSRDYLVTIAAANGSAKLPAQNDLAASRVEQFWAPVYKSFLITTPGPYVVTIHRNRSVNTIVSGIFIDRLAGPELRTDSESMPFTGGAYRFAPPGQTADLSKMPSDDALLQNIWNRFWSSGCDAPRDQSILLYRAARAARMPDTILAGWRWKLGLWTPDDRKSFDDYVALAKQSRIANLHRPVAALAVRS